MVHNLGATWSLWDNAQSHYTDPDPIMLHASLVFEYRPSVIVGTTHSGSICSFVAFLLDGKKMMSPSLIPSSRTETTMAGDLQ